MSKVIILGDTHFGVKSGNKVFHECFRPFYKELFEYIDKNNIREMIQLGDLFDNRKYINLWAGEFFREVFLKEVEKRKMKVHVLVGNHDSFFKDDISVNAPNLMLSNSKNFVVYDKPTTVEIGEDKFLMVPWVSKLNYDEVMREVAETDAQYCCGHFEFNGFEMYRGSVAKSNYSHKDFSKFVQVYSGHYHTQSTKDNVLYCGTPYELTWQDCGDPRGFWVHSHYELEFIKNNNTIYKKINYEDGEIFVEDEIRNKIIRVLLKTRPDKKKLNEFLQNLQNFEPIEIKVKELFVDEVAKEVEYHNFKDTKDVIYEYIEGSEFAGVDKEDIKKIFDELYLEAVNQE